MADTNTKNAARTRAQNHFAASEQRDTLVKQIIQAERAALDAKTAKLRALRLAKEAADREAADKLPPVPAKPKRARKRIA